MVWLIFMLFILFTIMVAMAFYNVGYQKGAESGKETSKLD